MGQNLSAREIELSQMTVDQRLAALDINDIDITLLRLVHQKLVSNPQASFNIAGYTFPEFILSIKNQEYEATWLPLLWQIFHYDPESFLSALQILRKVAALEFDAVNPHTGLPVIDTAVANDLSQAPVAMLTLDRQGCAHFANPLFLRYFGSGDLAGIAGKTVEELILNEPLAATAKQLLQGAQLPHHLLVSLYDGSATRFFECHVACASWQDESVLLITMEDTTQRMSSPEELLRFRMALDSSIDAIYLIDREQMRFIDANETATKILAYSRAELLQLGPQDLKPDAGELERINKRFDEIIHSDAKTGMIETVHQRKDGSRLPVEVYLRAMMSEQRQILVAVVRDISSRLKAEADLRTSEDKFRGIFNQAAIGLAHLTLEGRWFQTNKKFSEIVGYSPLEMQNMSFQELTHPGDLQADEEMVRGLIAGHYPNYTKEKRYIHKDGHAVWVNITVSLVYDRNGKPVYAVSAIEDITNRKKIEWDLLHLANHDSLTGLPNRLLIQDRLSQAIAHAHRKGTQTGVILIDIDRFKNINDSLGHGIGDLIIVEIGRRLSFIMKGDNAVGRLGGDEFVVMLSDLASGDMLAATAQNILDALSQPMAIYEHEFFLTGSLGLSVYPKDGADSQTLLKNADTAMYRAKDAGGNNMQFYAHEMNARALARFTTEGGLRRSLERDEFVLHYQPQIDVLSGRVVGMEALLRWQPLDKPAVAPAEFIPIAEETGLIVPIGEWVLRAACRQTVLWQEQGFAPLRVAVNLSARQFKQKNIVELVNRVLEETGCRPEWLELEITESVVMEDPQSATDTLQELSDMGVHLSIDDFGTGYSSLSYLKRFPIDTLKIDQSFVRDISTDADDAAIARAVIALAHSMRLEVVAEGVETIEQLEYLRAQGCDLMQGYYFSRPLPPEDIEKFLIMNKSRSRTTPMPKMVSTR
ncbi:EAL domain-containing protein [Undibacterium sp. TJN25]|uniref:sensor domain-containing protein n=1 Tax=Undibacterium sp. TJN25 TaxID=3413056 RepID=UPI003BF275DD